MQNSSTKRISTYGMLIALAFIFSYIESQIPFFLGVPGMKLGLANLVVLIALYLLGAKSAIVLSIIRVLLASISFGNMSMFWFSVAGAGLSFLVMALMKQIKGLSIVGISVAGGVAHNVGQIVVAMIILSKVMFYYLIVLIIGGTLTGAVIGVVGALILNKLKAALK